MRTGISLTVTPAIRRRLKAVAANRNSPQKHVWRAKIILLSADGVGTNKIMRRTGTSKTCVWRWQERFMAEGFEGLLRDKTRPSRVAPLGTEVAERVVALTQSDPPSETTHWTAPMMAHESGISVSSVQRIWRAYGLQPHRMRQFKLSNDPKFVEKLRDVVGLYVDPPAHAIVLSFDEKSQIQALDRTQPGLPMKKGRAGTMTHDYKRHGTTTLFAALDVLEGKVIGRCMQRHRHQEFIRFLNAIEAEVPAGKIVHVILDNYAAHKHPKVRAWLARHERFVFHFTPTSCSWLNAVEGYFAKLSKQRLKRGVFRSVVDLQVAINRFVAETNRAPKPFTWTANPDKIIAAVKRGHQVLDSVHSDLGQTADFFFLGLSNMEIQQLRHFAAVARYGHLGKAADEQRLTQSGITRSIQSLEEFLGVSLLLRTARGVVLTPVGRELVRHAEAIINQREHALEAVQAFMKGDAGTVTIGVTNVCDYFFMPEVATELLSQHPRLRLNTISGAYLDLVESLRMGAIELVVGLIDPTFRHPEIRVEELFVTRSVVACRSQHPLAKKKTHTVQDLSEARWAMSSGRGMQHAFDSFFQAHRLPHPSQILQTNSLTFLYKIIQTHDVLTILPWQLTKADVAAGRTCVIGTETPGDFARVGVAMLNAGNLSLAAGIVVNQIRASAEKLREVLSEDPITNQST